MTRAPDPAELEERRRQAFADRRFDPDSYAEELAPELSPELQVAIAAGELAEIDHPSVPTSEAEEELARQKAESDRMAREFCFLDPKDYEDEEARRGRVLTPVELLDLITKATGKQCWCSLASEAMVRKELSPRDVALAKLKIGNDPQNIYNPARWQDAIRDVREEERNLVPLRPYKLLALQICRIPNQPEYCCWFPAKDLREYDLVRFDSHGVPEQQIRGWRTVLLYLLMKRFCMEEDLVRVFGEATGPASSRYNMIVQGLRDQREPAGSVEHEVGLGALAAQDDNLQQVAEREAERCAIEGCDPPACSECHHHYGHFFFCSQFETWLNGTDIQTGG